MREALDVLSAVLLLTGTGLFVAATVGIARFPDVYDRMHAATKPATLGMVLLLAGTAGRVDDTADIAKLILVAILIFLTAPVGAHMIGRAAHRAGVPQSPTTHRDDLVLRERDDDAAGPAR
jgi:multicomponent Na+:H+ antiporter subunit G